MYSLRAYSKHRSCSLSAVQRAIKAGRLTEAAGSLTKSPSGVVKVRSFADADAEWLAATVPRAGSVVEATPEPATDIDISYSEGRRLREVESGRLLALQREMAELELAVRAGTMIAKTTVQKTVIEEYTSLKTRFLGLSTRIRQRIQSLSAADITIIDFLVREALNDAANRD